MSYPHGFCDRCGRPMPHFGLCGMCASQLERGHSWGDFQERPRRDFPLAGVLNDDDCSCPTIRGIKCHRTFCPNLLR